MERENFLQSVRSRLSGFAGSPGVLSPPSPQDVQFKVGRNEIHKAMLSEEGEPQGLC